MRRKLVAAVTSAALLTTGCSSVESLFEGDQHSASATTVELGTLPPRLPNAVKMMVANSIEVRSAVAIRRTKSTEVDKVGSASGIRISQNLYLTAGHMMVGGDGKMNKGLDRCGVLTIQAESSTALLQGSDAHSGHGVALPAQSFVASLAGANVMKAPDIAIARATDTYDLTAKPHKVMLADTQQVKPGTALYTINYEPAADGESRTPNEALLSSAQINAGLSKPAILGMITIAHLQSGLIDAVDTQRSYGKMTETQVRPGASGGPVYDGSGRLVGTIIEEVLDLTSQQIESREGITFRGVKPARMDEVLIQPVTAAMLQTYSAPLEKTSTCN